MPKQPSKKEEEHINPLLRDTSGEGFGTQPKGWTVIDKEEKIEEPVIRPKPANVSPPEEPVVLLYQTTPSAEYMARPFDRRYDKQAVNVNPYLSGALSALTRLLKQTKTEQYEEMALDYLKKHADMLERYPDLVRYYDEEMRRKHRL